MSDFGLCLKAYPLIWESQFKNFPWFFHWSPNWRALWSGSALPHSDVREFGETASWKGSGCNRIMFHYLTVLPRTHTGSLMYLLILQAQSRWKMLQQMRLSSYIWTVLAVPGGGSWWGNWQIAQLWSSFETHIHLVLVLDNNFYRCVHILWWLIPSSDLMVIIMWGVWNTYFSVFLANLELPNPSSSELISMDAFSFALSFILGNRWKLTKL